MPPKPTIAEALLGLAASAAQMDNDKFQRYLAQCDEAKKDTMLTALNFFRAGDLHDKAVAEKWEFVDIKRALQERRLISG